tara:strand:- start:5748 stop:6143 length:396 start_codon:yes stop_codon:yes gene_type:complete
MLHKKLIIKEFQNLGYCISLNELPLPNDKMNKKIFIEILNQLKKIDDRTSFLQSEIGLDSVAYDDAFFNVIDNLFKMIFNKTQVELIHSYLYTLSPDKLWDGTIVVGKDGVEKHVKFGTPSQVWDVIKSIE